MSNQTRDALKLAGAVSALVGDIWRDKYNAVVVEKDTEIERLKGELEEAEVDLKGVMKDYQEVSAERLPLWDKIEDLERQLDASQALLAEARSEIERLSSPDYYACAMCPDIKEARQEAAREICDYLQRSSTDDEISKGYVIDHINRRFGLEG